MIDYEPRKEGRGPTITEDSENTIIQRQKYQGKTKLNRLGGLSWIRKYEQGACDLIDGWNVTRKAFSIVNTITNAFSTWL